MTLTCGIDIAEHSNMYALFPPCPNPFPLGDARFACNLVIDSYSFTLYALPMAQLDDLPKPDIATHNVFAAPNRRVASEGTQGVRSLA